MARASWLNDDDHPLIDEQLEKLEHFTSAMADGTIDAEELDKQQANLAKAMEAVESELSDELHEKVTRVLVELSAYNVMSVLHGLAAERARHAFAGK